MAICILKVSSLDEKGFCEYDNNTSVFGVALLPVGTELNVAQNQWIWWGNVEFKTSNSIILKQDGIELSSGTEITEENE